MKKINTETIELTIESLAYQGYGVSKKDGIVYFVTGGVPGDVVNALITRKKARYREARINYIVKPSENRIEPPCKYFGLCGGCSFQQISYNEQIHWKKQQVIDSFERIGKVPVSEYSDTLPAIKQFHFRNKMEFSFGASRWMTAEEISQPEEIQHKNFAVGLHIPGRFDKVLDIDGCLIQPESGNAILNSVRDPALKFGTTAENARTHEGFLRNLIIRWSHATGEIMVVLVSCTPETPQDSDFLKWFENDFIRQHPEITTLIHTINDAISPVATGQLNILHGCGFITEMILGLNYRISPFSFFQTNSAQLDRFIGSILEFAQIKDTDKIWDLYCGTGSISLPAAKMAEHVWIELVQSSINDALLNSKLNNITNVEFHACDLHDKQINNSLLRYPKPDTIIIDPPRAGMHPNLINTVLAINPERIVYVSCNPASQARDCQFLAESYNINKVMPVDMFPQTYHIEAIAELVRKI